MNTISTINVPFHGSNLYVVNYNGQPYVPMRPIVEGMGMDWTGQLNKLKQKFKSTVEEISIVAADDEQLTSLKVFADLAESRGYVMVKKDDTYCDSAVRSNVNAAYGNFKILKEIWYEKINPFLSTFSPEISSLVSGAMGNVDGPIYLAKLSLTPKLPA